MNKEYKKPESAQQAIDNYRTYREYGRKVENVNYLISHLQEIDITKEEKDKFLEQLQNLRSGLLDEETAEHPLIGVMINFGVKKKALGISLIDTLEEILKKT